jgi:glycosyltransferase involved in cell wall biosynthesis
MKIIFLAPFGIRPKGTLIARMLPIAMELRNLGHEVVIVAPPYTNPEDSGTEETVNSVRLVNIRLAACRSLGAPLMAWRMFRAAIEERPDVIHLFKPKGYGGLAVMMMQLFDMIGVRTPPLFVDCDDLEGNGGMNDLKRYGFLERLLYDFQERFIPRHAHGVTVASRMLEAEMGNKGVPHDYLHYLPNGIFSDRCLGGGKTVRNLLGIQESDPVLLLYTRFFEFDQKRLYAVLENLLRLVPACRILVVGSGPDGEEKALVKAAGDRGFSGSLIMAGWLDPEDIPDYLAAGDVGLYLLDDTRINRAKCPAKLTELLASGIPVIADRIGQVAEYVEKTEITTFRNDSELVERLAELLNNPALKASAGKAACEYMQQNFNWKPMVAKLDEFYRQRIPGLKSEYTT